MATTVNTFRSGNVALVRAVAQPALNLPPWPDLAHTGADPVITTARITWLRQVWKDDHIAEGLRLASPELARQIEALLDNPAPGPRDLRRAALSVGRYLLRTQSRATPFGLFAGVTTADFSADARADWGTGHQAVVAASAEWLAAIITRLESIPELLAQLPLVANSTLTIRGERVIIPYQPNAQLDRGTAAVEVTLLHTAPVRAAIAAAGAPIRGTDLVDMIVEDFPAAGPGKVHRLVTELVARRVLISALHAPSTETDPLGHLVAQLDAAGPVPESAELLGQVRETREQLTACNALPAGGTTPGAWSDTVEHMRSVVLVRQHPLAVDLRLDAAVSLPPEVAREVERAALVLARVGPAPYGSAAWKEYHQRFYERFGIGTMVPLLDVVADSGLGYPDGYPGSFSGERRAAVSARDEALVRLAQAAALDGRDEVVLDDELITTLSSGPDRVRLPHHLEVGVRVHAASTEALNAGDFQLEVVSVSRGAGVSTGRFLHIVATEGRTALEAELSDLPGGDGATVAAQLSFPPLVADTAHVTRSPQLLPLTISLGEHRAPDEHVLTAKDLAVGCDGRRMYLAAPGRGHRVEAVGMHALNLHTHTPPLARFLTELSRAQCAAVTLFGWGAARTMPFLPRLRYGRTVLSPARWRLEPTELPTTAGMWAEWDAAFTDWRARRRLPHRVYLTEGDRLLALNLDHVGHRVLLRAHLDRDRVAVLTEAPLDAGWCGGRPHEVIVPLKAAEPPQWPALPQPTTTRIIGRDHGHTPGTSPVLLASLYGDIHRQDTILADFLPDLLNRLGQPPWWYVRFRDPDQHLRLRIALAEPSQFGEIAHQVSTWSDELHHAGVLREVRYSTSYPETGRWGAGAAWAAAEDVFRADSRALLTQLRQPTRPRRRALVAAHTVAIACAFHGDTAAGMQWLIDRIPATAPEPVPRPQFTEAVRLADPRNNWAALRAEPGGDVIATAATERDLAVAEYSRHLPGPDTHGISADDVLGSLLHVHFVRAVAVDFPEEAICLYLARAAALAWTARTTGWTR